MQCEAVVERLPWLLNRSLSADEEREVRDHVAGCAACRVELERTGWHWEASRQHLAPEVLVSHVAGDDVPDHPAGEIAAHLAACTRCAEERDLLVEGRGAVERLATYRTEKGGQASGKGWRTLAIAASVFGVAVLAGWLQQQGRIQEMRREADEIGRRLEALEEPRLNVPIFELAPGEALRGEGEPREIRLPPDARSVMLILLPGRVPDRDSLTVKVLDAAGRMTWSGTGLARSPMGDFTLSLPVEILQPGLMSLEIYAGDQTEPAERYEISVRRADR